MKLKKGKSVNHVFHAAMLPTAVFSIGLTVPAPAAHATIAQPEEIIVTARRTEEVLQNIPISMTVFNQEMLDERNVVSGTDLVKYTPSLSVNTRFGSDQASFAIRGFTQELRTTASVAVYFADVVAPRGGGSVTSGDGAGPGSFFDLQNVQVLKGPQGTLFGRNTTGGAIQLVPQEPTNKTEGYLELSAGNYDMKRAQGVINLPISDMARARFGVDTQKRDGYIKNSSGIGPDHLSDTDYIAARASLILDLTDTVQNYTIFSYTKSENNGSIQGMYACNPAIDPATGQRVGLASLCDATIAHQGNDFYTVESDTENPVSKLKQWQAINTTTWDITDDFTVKNILSYADLEQTMRTSVFGTNFYLPDALAAFGVAGAPLTFQMSGQYPGMPTNSQTTFVEELQFQGAGLDGSLTWQAGLYYENSRPDGLSGSMSPAFLSCAETLGSDSADWLCMNPLGAFADDFNGSVQANVGKIEYINQAVYSQATYDINDEFRTTVGLRYTVDETKATSQQVTYSGFENFTPSSPTVIGCVMSDATGPECKHRLRQKSEAPTWLIDFDYLPTPDVMIYAKYARGYRQGSISMFSPEGLQTYDPEEVDSYEIGAKTTFGGPVPGTLNISLFYNEITDQQLQATYIPKQGSATTAILNAGASTIQGMEIETTLRLLDSLSLNIAYTYLDTRLDELVDPPWDTDVYNSVSASAQEGGHLAFSPRHNVTAGLSYKLPLPADVGDVSAGATYTYVSKQISAVSQIDESNYYVASLDSYELVNLNLGWKAVMGSAFDAALFVTNALGEEYATYSPGLYSSGGMEFRVVGEPRMYGARIKYNFGL